MPTMKEEVEAVAVAINQALNESESRTGIAKAAIAALDAVRAQQQPVAWIDDAGLRMLVKNQRPCIINYVPDEDWKNPLYLSPAASPAPAGWIQFLEKWVNNGLLQTFESRERFRTEAKAMLDAVPAAGETGERK